MNNHTPFLKATRSVSGTTTATINTTLLSEAVRNKQQELADSHGHSIVASFAFSMLLEEVIADLEREITDQLKGYTEELIKIPAARPQTEL